MIRIVNLRNYKLNENELLIKVDRSSVVGNPFYMHNESERDLVCDKYEQYFQKKVLEKGEYRNEIIRIYRLAKEHDIALACWCYPKRCHAETIKRFIDCYIKKKGNVNKMKIIKSVLERS